MFLGYLIVHKYNHFAGPAICFAVGPR